MDSYARLAKDRRFSHRGRNHTGYFPEGLQKVIDPKTSREFPRMALCNCLPTLHDVAPKKAATGDLLGCNAHGRIRGVVL